MRLSLILVLSSLLAPGVLGAQLRGLEPEWYLPVNSSCRLFVQEFGTGADTVVVLHGGFGAEHSYMLEAFQGLDSEYHFIIYDQRGSLRSPCPDSLVSFDSHLEDLELLRQELGLERMVLAGHSMGSFLAMSYLERYPSHLRGLILFGPLLPRSPVSEAEEAQQRELDAAVEPFLTRPAVMEAIRREGLDRPMEELTAKERTNHWRIRFAGANLYRVDRWRELKGGQVFYSQAAGNAAARTRPQRWDYTDALAAFPFPVTVIVGDHDFIGLGGARHRELFGPIPGVELIVLTEAGHNAWIDRPEAFHQALAGALAKYR